jgi:hypothetical protein
VVVAVSEVSVYHKTHSEVDVNGFYGTDERHYIRHY